MKSSISDNTKLRDLPLKGEIYLGYGESKVEGVMDSYTATHHAHTRKDEKQQYGIGVRSTLQEALAGGMNTVFGMSNTQRIDPQGNRLGAVVNMDNLENFVEDLDAAEKEGLGRHYIHVAATNTNLKELERMLEHKNVAGVKIYPEAHDGSSVTTSFATGANKEGVSKLTVEKNGVIDQIADLCIQNKKTLTWHSETPGVWPKNYGGGEFPIAALHSGIERIIALSLRKPELKLVNAHTSLMQEAEMLIDANQKFGTNIWIELSPQYMVLSQETHVFKDSKYGNSIYKCFPNVRKQWNNHPLTQLLASEGEDGVNILEGGDHAPHAAQEKKPFTFAIKAGNVAGITDILNFVYNEGKATSENKKTEERAESFPFLFEGGAGEHIAEVLNKISSKHTHLSLDDRENRINFIKGFGGLPNLRDSVPLWLSIASKTDMTLGQFKNFIGNNCKQLHNTLTFNTKIPEKERFMKVDPYKPQHDYYNGAVINPWKDTELQFKNVGWTD